MMEKINQDKNVQKRPDFIVVTAVGQERITEDAFNRGANYYIMKPFNNEMLLNRIKTVRRPVRSCEKRNDELSSQVPYIREGDLEKDVYKRQDPDYGITKEIQKYIEQHGRECILAKEDEQGFIFPGTVPENVDCGIVLGGDGTLIRAARELAEYELSLIHILQGMSDII